MKKREDCGQSAARFKPALFWLFAALAPLCVSACALRGGGERQAAAEGVDSGLITASVGRPSAVKIDPKLIPDREIILAQFAALAGQGSGQTAQSWQNAAASSSGIISALGPPRGKAQGKTAPGRTCRAFQTTRESFDGISLYQGEACKYGQNPWALSYLQEK